jgi:hypothetical protein
MNPSCFFDSMKKWIFDISVIYYCEGICVYKLNLRSLKLSWVCHFSILLVFLWFDILNNCFSGISIYFGRLIWVPLCFIKFLLRLISISILSFFNSLFRCLLVLMYIWWKLDSKPINQKTLSFYTRLI